MKGDFSRFTDRPERHYDRVLQQQGRVQTDADWNEQGDLLIRRQRAALRDLIGEAGVPADRPGFAITGHGGLLFDGRGHYLEATGASPLFLSGDAFTIEAWIKPASHGGGITIASRPQEMAGGFRFGLTASRRLCFERAASAEDGQLTVRAEVIGRQVLAEDRFSHVAAVSQDGWLRLYVNGKLDHEAAGGEGLPFEPTPLLIGADHTGGRLERFFVGVIDRPRLWGRALDGRDVAAAMSGTLDGALCHWRHRHHGDGYWTDHGPHGLHAQAGGGDPARMPPLAVPEVWIGAGHCYIAGVLCENDQDRRFDQQADGPGLELPDLIRHPGPYLALLDSWDRTVGAIEDPAIRESALGGIDTAARSQVVAQVRLWPLPEGASAHLPRPHPRGRLRVTEAPNATARQNQLYRVEVHAAGFAAGAPADSGGFPLHDLSIERGGRTVVATLAEPLEPGGMQVGQAVELHRHGHDGVLTGKIAQVQVQRPGVIAATLLLDHAAGHHDGGWELRPIASFKWSADNGAWTFPVETLDSLDDGATVHIADPAGSLAMLHRQDWAEIVDDATTLRGLPGPLCRIDNIDEDDPAGIAVTLGGACPDPLGRSATQRLTGHPLLRRWDSLNQTASGAVAIGAPVAIGDAALIEFAAGFYATGDYWQIPARQRLEWPVEAGQPAWLPPAGIDHRRTELAVLRYDGSSVEVEDLRRRFPPLTRPDALPPLPPAIRRLEEKVLAERAPSKVEALAAACILGLDDSPPEGWRHSGIRLAVRSINPEWSPAANPLPLGDIVAAAALDGLIFYLAGDGAVAAYDPRSGRASTDLPPCPIESAAMARLGVCAGRLHVLSGDQHNRHLRFEPDQGEWQECAPLPHPRAEFALAALGDRLLALGGARPGTSTAVNTVEAYDPATDSWHAVAALPRAVRQSAAVASHGRLYVVGGIVAGRMGLGHEVVAEAHAYAPRTDRWSELPPCATARGGATVVAAEDRLCLIGGTQANGKPAPAEFHDLQGDRWLAGPQPWHDRVHSALAWHDGVLFLAGERIGAAPDGALEICRIENLLHIHARK